MRKLCASHILPLKMAVLPFLKHWATVNKHFLYTVSTFDIVVPDTSDKLYVFIVFDTVEEQLLCFAY